MNYIWVLIIWLTNKWMNSFTFFRMLEEEATFHKNYHISQMIKRKEKWSIILAKRKHDLFIINIDRKDQLKKNNYVLFLCIWHLWKVMYFTNLNDRLSLCHIKISWLCPATKRSLVLLLNGPQMIYSIFKNLTFQKGAVHRIKNCSFKWLQYLMPSTFLEWCSELKTLQQSRPKVKINPTLNRNLIPLFLRSSFEPVFEDTYWLISWCEAMFLNYSVLSS